MCRRANNAAQFEMLMPDDYVDDAASFGASSERFLAGILVATARIRLSVGESWWKAGESG